MKLPPFLIAVAGVSLGLGTSAAAQSNDPPEYRCGSASLTEVRRKPPFPGLFGALIPPFALINALSRDDLAKLPTGPVSFRVVDDKGRDVPSAMIGIIFKDANRFIAEGKARGPAIPLPQGAYVINAAVRDKDGVVRWGVAETTVRKDVPSSVTVKLQYTLPTANLKPASDALIAGFNLPIEVSGLSQPKATLGLVRTGADPVAPDKDGEGPLLADATIEAGRASVLELPGKPGKYDVVYLLCAPRITLARVPVTVARANVAMEAPDQAPMGSKLRVALRGTLSPAYTVHLSSDDTSAQQVNLDTGNEQVTEIKVPWQPGKYELSLRTHDDVVLARRTVSVSPVSLTLSGPDVIQLGHKVSYTWPAQGSPATFRLELWTKPAKGEAKRVAELGGKDDRPAVVPGDYELRLMPWGVGNDRILARKTVRLEGRAFDNPPREVAAGSDVTVSFALPADFFDRVGFAPRGGEFDMFEAKSPRSAGRMTLTAPKKPGSYDLVFMLGTVGERAIAERVPIEVK